jgi:predicted nuclease of predicted toxin-antitoxin system
VKILVDENIPLLCVEHLRKTGHDVVDMRGTEEEGISDEAIWTKAQHDRRLLITTDKGFARRRNENPHGILVVSLRRPNRHKLTRRIIEAMGLFSSAQWPGQLVVMRDTVMSTWRMNASR